MTIRVVHCGTGLTGREALRAIIGDPRLELVGQYVSTPEKVGKDAGDLCGLAPTGVIATGDLDAVVALGADCLCYVRERRELHDMSRTVLVSGATRGVGRGIAALLSGKYALDLLHTHRFAFDQAEEAILTLAGRVDGEDPICITVTA